MIYVWFDALANYLSVLGLAGDEAALDRFWRGGGERVHVIGKGVTRFHAVYWPAFLLSAGLPVPDRIAVHGYLTVDGEKISKSGRSVGVEPVIERAGVDALRWYFARRCRTRADADVSIDAVCDAYDGDLVDRLGNLVQRTTALAAKLTGGRVPAVPASPASPASGDRCGSAEVRALAEALPARVDAALDAFLPDDAAAAIVELLDAANRGLEVAAPWRLQRTDAAAAAAALYAPLEAARIAAGELAPFVPTVARTIAARLGEPDLAPRWGLLVPGAALPVGPPPLPRIRVRAPAA